MPRASNAGLLTVREEITRLDTGISSCHGLGCLLFIRDFPSSCRANIIYSQPTLTTTKQGEAPPRWRCVSRSVEIVISDPGGKAGIWGVSTFLSPFFSLFLSLSLSLSLFPCYISIAGKPYERASAYANRLALVSINKGRFLCTRIQPDNRSLALNSCSELSSPAAEQISDKNSRQSSRDRVALKRPSSWFPSSFQIIRQLWASRNANRSFRRRHNGCCIWSFRDFPSEAHAKRFPRVEYKTEV